MEIIKSHPDPIGERGAEGSIDAGSIDASSLIAAQAKEDLKYYTSRTYTFYSVLTGDFIPDITNILEPEPLFWYMHSYKEDSSIKENLRLFISNLVGRKVRALPWIIMDYTLHDQLSENNYLVNIDSQSSRNYGMLFGRMVFYRSVFNAEQIRDIYVDDESIYGRLLLRYINGCNLNET